MQHVSCKICYNHNNVLLFLQHTETKFDFKPYIKYTCQPYRSLPLSLTLISLGSLSDLYIIFIEGTHTIYAIYDYAIHYDTEGLAIAS